MSNIKTPISKYFLAHLASLVQARTVLNGEVQQERRARPCRGPLDVPINALSPPRKDRKSEEKMLKRIDRCAKKYVCARVEIAISDDTKHSQIEE